MSFVRPNAITLLEFGKHSNTHTNIHTHAAQAQTGNEMAVDPQREQKII